MAGGLPPESGFTYLDDVPARVMLDLAHRGARLAKEHGSSAGPPVSLLDQEVIQVSSADVVVGLPMRCVFALTAMGFLPQSAETISADELIRPDIAGVVASGRPLRLGLSASRPRGAGAALMGEDGSFPDRRHTHSGSTALVSLSSASRRGVTTESGAPAR